jgi:DUF4097 and DUF4098 domain-containing protein YvlB
LRTAAALVPLALGVLAGGPLAVADLHAQFRGGFTEPFERTVTIGSGGLLDLSNLSGRITVTGGGGRDVVISATKRARNARSDAEASTLFGGVRIDVAERTGRVVVRTIYGARSGRRGSVGVDYTVRVPRDTALELRSVSGDIEVSDVRGETRVEVVSGDLTLLDVTNLARAKTVSGDVEVVDAAGARDTSLAVVSGDLRVRNLKAPRIEVESVSGDVDLTDLETERLNVGSVSGDVRFQGPLARTGRYEVNSHSGSVRLRVAGSGFDLEAQTFSGDIDTNVSVLVPPGTTPGRRGRRSQELRGAVDGGGALLSIRTFSGDITISRD